MWEELVNRALLGTEKQGFRPLAGGGAGALGGLLARLDISDAEGALLRTAGVLAVYRRAGVVPAEAAGETAPPAPEETRKPCSERAVRLLEQMLDGTNRTLLPVWLERAAATGKRLPPSGLVGVLELGRQDRELRNLIRPVLGKRGHWLAAQNPEWNYLAGEADDDRTWEEGAWQARSAYLANLRGRDPARARQLLESVWKSEPARERAEFLGRLETGLSPDDEPFLEAALDDRSKEVRTTAAGLLARLPGSRYSVRMTERLRTLISLEKRMLRAPKLEVRLPEELDAAMKRDGIVEKGSLGFSMGDKAGVLYQVVRAVPPSFWQAEWGLAPAEWVAAAEKSEWTVPLHLGWRDAAAASVDREWIGALLDHRKGEVLKPVHNRRPLLDALPPEARRARLLEEIRGGKLDDQGMLLSLPGPWDAELSRAALEIVVLPMVKKASGWSYTWDEILRALAAKLAPEVLPEAEEMAARVKDEESARGRTLAEFLTVFRFRLEILEELEK